MFKKQLKTSGYKSGKEGVVTIGTLVFNLDTRNWEWIHLQFCFNTLFSGGLSRSHEARDMP
jgi:hypothetical protein